MIGGPGVVEVFQSQLPASVIAPEAEAVPAAVEALPGLVEKRHRAVQLNLGMLRAEVQGVLIGGALQAQPGGLDYHLFGSDLPSQPQKDYLPGAAHPKLPGGEIGGDRLGVSPGVIPGLYQFLG